MLFYWQKGELQFTTDVEDWMADLDFTEVFRYNGSPSTQEMEITRELDRILHEVRYGPKGIEDTLSEIARSKATMTSGRVRPGQQSRGQMEGSAVDEVFKGRLHDALHGRLKHWENVLSTTDKGYRGADVYSRPIGAAWDVTTVADVWTHVERDVFCKRGAGKPRIGDVWDRYYILVWDDPRTNRKTKADEIQKGRLP